MKIESLTGSSLQFDQDIYTLSLKERSQRAAKMSALFFGLAVFSVFIPMLHFFLVPAFLGLTVYTGYKKIRELYRIDLTTVRCPVCSKHFKETLMYSQHKTFRLYCYECQTQLKVTET